MAKKYWLMKSEPNEFSIQDLERVGTEPWDGVRNYQARNFMRDDMRVGDEVLFYHSNSKPSGIAGLAKVSKEAFADFTAWDEQNSHFDPKSTEAAPIWMMVEVEYQRTFPRVISLAELKNEPSLEEMLVCKRGMRLSVQPVDKKHVQKVLKMAERD